VCAHFAETEYGVLLMGLYEGAVEVSLWMRPQWPEYEVLLMGLYEGAVEVSLWMQP